MLLTRSRHIIVALLLLTFVGQAVASASMSCQNPAAQSPPQQQMMDAAGMDHSQHTGMSTTDSPDWSECCPDCDCSLGGCVTFALPVSEHTFASDLTTLSGRYISLAENQPGASLFRPPISR